MYIFPVGATSLPLVNGQTLPRNGVCFHDMRMTISLLFRRSVMFFWGSVNTRVGVLFTLLLRRPTLLEVLRKVPTC
jgi:hypothetical protein